MRNEIRKSSQQQPNQIGNAWGKQKKKLEENIEQT